MKHHCKYNHNHYKKNILCLVFALLIPCCVWGEGTVNGSPVPFAEQGSVHGHLQFSHFVQSVAPSVVGVSFEVCSAGPFYLPPNLFDGLDRASTTSDVCLRHRNFQSGFVLSQDGHIVTQFLQTSTVPSHIIVSLDDGSHHPATLVGLDRSTGLAVLKINAINLFAVRVGALTNTHQWVFAIGHAVKEKSHIAVGHVTTTQSPIIFSNKVAYMDTNMEISPESTSGLLVDMSGRMLGMLYVPDYDHHVYVLPVQQVKKITHQLQRFGKVIHAYAGFVMEPGRPSGKSAQHGATIAAIQKSSAAEKAGFKPGDNIVAINGEKVSCANDVFRAVDAEEPGSVVRVRYTRHQQENTTLLKLAVLPVPQVERRSIQIVQDRHLPFLFAGAQFKEMTAKELAARHIQWGLLITSLSSHSLSAKMGIHVGDVLIAMNGRKNISVHQLKEIFDKDFHDTVTVMIQNGFVRIYVS